MNRVPVMMCKVVLAPTGPLPPTLRVLMEIHRANPRRLFLTLAFLCVGCGNEPEKKVPVQTSSARSEPAPHGYFFIRNRVSGMCLGVRPNGQGPRPGTAVDIYPCDLAENGYIHWRFETAEEGHVLVRNRYSPEYCLGVREVDQHDPGDEVEIYHCNPEGGDPGQDNRWRLGVADGDFLHIKNKVSDLCLGVREVDTHGEGAEVEVYHCDPGNGDPGLDNQWGLTPVGDAPLRDFGCHLSENRSTDGDLAVLTLSLHHREDPVCEEQLPLKGSDVDTLADEIVAFWPDPSDLLIPVVNAPGRFIAGDECAWMSSSCLKDRLRDRYNVELTWSALYESIPELTVAPSPQNNMAMIVGPDWEIVNKQRVEFPDWVRFADGPIEPNGCLDEGQPRHYGIFDVRKRTPPHTTIRFYFVYLCVSGGDWTPKAKMLRYVLNAATADKTGDVSPFIVGDWNLSAIPTRGLSVKDYAELVDHKPIFNDTVSYHMALTVQQEVRNRTQWIDDVNRNACQGDPFVPELAQKVCAQPFLPSNGCHENIVEYGGDINSCSDGSSFCAFWGCQPWSKSANVVHLAQVRDPTRPLLTPMYHPYWKGRHNTWIKFATVSHPAFMTVFETTSEKPKPPTSFRDVIAAADPNMAHECGQASGATSWAGGNEVCWLIDGPRGEEAYRARDWDGLRVAFTGATRGSSAVLEFKILEEEAHVVWPGVDPPGSSPDLAPDPPSPDPSVLRVRALDEFRSVDGQFCESFIVSGLADRKMNFQVRMVDGAWVRLDDIIITDLGSDPCAPPCTPSCVPGKCGMSNGCGGTCKCPTGSVCNNGLCEPSSDCQCLDFCGCLCGKRCGCPGSKVCDPDIHQCIERPRCDPGETYCESAGSCLAPRRCPPLTPCTGR
jgi:hypothetical protein